MNYDFKKIESKWRKFWKNNQTFKTSNNSKLPKFYILDMFPYPSGAGLHVGHPLGYIATDIFARYKRHKKFNVLHPQGYDSFGLPAEQYAIQTGHGKDVTIVSYGKIIKEAYKAADILAKEGIDSEIIDLRTIRPMDHKMIFESVKKTNRLVILEESWPFGNISTEITYQVQNQIFDYLDAPIEKINTADTPAPFSPVLLEEWLPNHEDVIKAVKKVIYHNT